MQISIDAAKFTPDEANGLRRAMATFRKVGTIQNYEGMMVSRMAERGYRLEFAQRCFDQVKGFGEYGFPESHAASFALLVYVSSWLKCHHPDVFCAALLNSQPMGFYAPAQIVRDAREHGVDVRCVDVNYSDWDNTLEPAGTGSGLKAVRLGFRQVDGVREDEMEALMRARGQGFDTLDEVRLRTGLTRRAMELLAAADAFGSLGLCRRDALWAVRGDTAGSTLPLFEAAKLAEQGRDSVTQLPRMPDSEQVIQDYQTTRLSLKDHPLRFLRPFYDSQRILTTAEAVAMPDGQRVETCGLVLVRQRPGSANGVVFITIEDELGIANIVVWKRVMERFRPIVMGARILSVRGRVQSADSVTHIVAEQLIDRSADLALLSEECMTDPLKGVLANADEVKRPIPEGRWPAAEEGDMRRHPRNVRAIPRSRDFH